METSYIPKAMPYSQAMSRIQRQFSCDRTEAYKLMKQLIAYKCIKLEEDKDEN